MEKTNLKKVNLKIEGMHCASCEVFIERKFKQIAGVEKVNVNHGTGKAELECSSDPDIRELKRAIINNGYKVSLVGETEPKKETRPEQTDNDRITLPITEDHIETGVILFIVLALAVLAQNFNLLPKGIGVSNDMSYLTVFVIGLVASTSTCLAVSGGLLLSVTAKYAEQHPEMTGVQKFKPSVYFNAGRIISYIVFGGLIGAFGSLFIISPSINSALVILTSIVMIVLGLQMLNIFPWLNQFKLKMPKIFAHKIYDANESQSKAGPFLFGTSTFFLPCGFTMALQLYVLGKGSIVIGALTMLVFSLATLPALMSVGAISSIVKGDLQRRFLKFSGVLVAMLGIFSLSNGLAIYGIGQGASPSSSLQLAAANQSGQQLSLDPNVQMVNGTQIVKMQIAGYDYSPSRFTVRVGVPVEWQIDASNAAGCAQVIDAPTLGIQKQLSSQGVTTIEFTPTQIGNFGFNCPMGMTTRGAGFTVQ